MHLRFWSDGADFRTEAHKLFNARTMHTTYRHQKDDLGNALQSHNIWIRKVYKNSIWMKS